MGGIGAAALSAGLDSAAGLAAAKALLGAIFDMGGIGAAAAEAADDFDVFERGGKASGVLAISVR